MILDNSDSSQWEQKKLTGLDKLSVTNFYAPEADGCPFCYAVRMAENRKRSRSTGLRKLYFGGERDGNNGNNKNNGKHGKKHKTETSPAQQDSENSILGGTRWE